MNDILKTLYFIGVMAEIVIRVPHERQRRQTRIALDRVSGLERLVLGLLFMGSFFIPAVYVFTPWLDRANYRLSPGAKGWAGGIGTAVLAAAIWLFWRSHADLGRNWSPSLQLREGHTLVTEGV